MNVFRSMMMSTAILRAPEGVTTIACATPKTGRPAPQGAPEDNGIPAMFDRIKGKTKDEIAAMREAAIDKHARKSLASPTKPAAPAKPLKVGDVVQSGAVALKVARVAADKPLGTDADAQVKSGRSNVAKPTKAKPAPKATAKTKSASKAKPAVKAKKPPTAKANPPTELRPDGLRKGSKIALLVDTVCRAKGATNEELKAAVGWAQCLPMMKKGCEKAGVKVRTEKLDGKPTRYFGTPKKAK